jgi:two-component system CheB/CheR fusion protein
MINPASSSPLRTQPGAARVVAIGSSAGSLHALGQFFASATGTWSDTAFVVVVHLPPDFESHLAELLAQSTSLAVSAIEDNAPIRGGHVYVIPPKVSVSVLHGAFRLAPAVERPEIPMPIDCLFASLAADQHERAIGIVLTGANADGSAGLRAIKAEGGMVMAQDPETAEHSTMPSQAIATGLVDYVLPVEKMAAALTEYIDRVEKRDISSSRRRRAFARSRACASSAGPGRLRIPGLQAGHAGAAHRASHDRETREQFRHLL